MGNINITIDGINIGVDENLTLLEAAEANGFHIPSLCFLKDINKGGICRICVCEDLSTGKLITACNTKIREGLNVSTCSQAVVESRRKNLQLITEEHDGDCTECVRGGDCELQALCQEYGVDIRRFAKITKEPETDRSGMVILRDNSKCVLCRRCVTVCKNMLGESAIGVFGRGGNTKIGIGIQIKDTHCINCGLCAAYCPVGALVIRDNTFLAWKAITSPSKQAIAVVTPEAAIQIGECFGESIGKDNTGKLVTILKNIGFNAVYKASENAMATIEAERSELEKRKTTGKLPMISSTCPGIKEYIKRNRPELAELVSNNVNGNMAICGQVKKKIENAFCVLMCSCALEKAAYKENTDVDVVLSVPEIATMIKKACVSSFTAMNIWKDLKASAADSLGGQMQDVRASYGISNIVAGDKGVTVSGPKQIDALLDDITAGRCEYEYVEMLLCPGGCHNGGGQSHQNGAEHSFKNLIEARKNNQ